MANSGCVRVLKHVFDTLDLSNIPSVQKWLKYCNNNIDLLTASKESSASSIRIKSINDLLLQLEKYKVSLEKMIYLLSNSTDCCFGSIIWANEKSVFNGEMQTGKFVNIRHKDPRQFLLDALKVLKENLNKHLRKMYIVKMNTMLSCSFKKLSPNGVDLEFFNKNILSSCHIIDQGTNYQLISLNIQKELLSKLEKSQEVESGWIISEIVSLTVNINKFEPLTSALFCELTSTDLLKSCCVIVKNNDKAAFAWSIVVALFKPTNCADQVTSYPHYTKVLNMKGISTPFKLNEITLFEKNNVISVNVFKLQRKNGFTKIVPIRLTKEKHDRHINLLLFNVNHGISDLDDIYDFNNMKNIRVCWIKDLKRLITNQLPIIEYFFDICERCLQRIPTEEKFKKHILECNMVQKGKVIVPSTNKKWLSFTNIKNKERSPYVIYAGVRSFVNPESVESLYTNNPSDSHKHEIHSIGYYFVCSYDSTLNYYKSFRGDNAHKWFANELKKLAENMETTFICKVPIADPNPVFPYNVSKETHCFLCGNHLKRQTKTIQYSCNLTGKIKGVVHPKCLADYNNSESTPTVSVIFHNLNSDDSDCILKGVLSEFNGKLHLLQFNNERHFGFVKEVDDSQIIFRFIDSYNFLPSQLSQLISICDNLSFIRAEIPFNIDLLLKNYMSYDAFKTWSNFNGAQLPLQQHFLNKTSKVKLSSEDYNHAQNVWSAFKLQTMGDYSDLYLKKEIMTLVEVFEELRCICMISYSLDPTHYVSPSELSWDAMLHYTKIKLQPITDIEMLHFIERGIHPAIIQTNQKYSKAKNSYMMGESSASVDKKFLMYFTVNHLYEWAFSQYLPHSGFKWMKDEDIEKFNIKFIADDSLTGYILEVDLEYPIDGQNLHEDLPFILGLKPNQQNKERYVVHYQTLQQFLKNDIILIKTHKILQYKQSPWLRNFIDLNLALRVTAKNQFEQNFYTHINNSLISNGWTFESLRTQSNIRLASTWFGRRGVKNMIAKPNFLNSYILDEDLVAIQMLNNNTVIEKPIYVHQAVFAIAKLNIYDFHYNYMSRTFPNTLKLLYFDSEILIYEIQILDVYKSIALDIHKFTTYGYLKGNPYGILQANKMLPGLIRDLLNGKIMTEYLSTGPRMYGIKVDNKDFMEVSKESNNLLINRLNSFDCMLKT